MSLKRLTIRVTEPQYDAIMARPEGQAEVVRAALDAYLSGGGPVAANPEKKVVEDEPYERRIPFLIGEEYHFFLQAEYLKVRRSLQKGDKAGAVAFLKKAHKITTSLAEKVVTTIELKHMG